MYNYNAKVVRVVDGDTAEVLADLGFRVFVSVTLRFYGINAPEKKGATKEAGNKAKDRLKELIEGKDVVIDSKKLDKYGRTVATVYLNGANINEQMVKEGFAVAYMVDDA